MTIFRSELLDQARETWRQAANAVTVLMTELATSGATGFSPPTPGADLRRRLTAARAAERLARKNVHVQLQASLPPTSNEEAERLDARVPVVFFPVRLETRFELVKPARRVPTTWVPNLMVRVYPDEISATSHDPALTLEELAAGREYWSNIGPYLFEPQDEVPAPWRKLLMTYPVERAAWIVRATQTTAAPPLRPPGWARPVMADTLPDRFAFLAFRQNVRVAAVIGNAIPDPLQLSLDPFAEEQTGELTDVSGHGLEIDADVQWTIDFEAALQAGMAARIPLDAEGKVSGFDQVFAVGIKSSLDAQQSALRLSGLFGGHGFAEGFGYVRQGTPTNHTSDARSGALAPDFGSDTELTRALGIPRRSRFDTLAGRTENDNARAFQHALWPATMGYFARQFLDPLASAEEIEEARAHFAQYVRARGPLPAFRVGSTPYGALPVTVLSQWPPPGHGTAFERAISGFLRKLLEIWNARTGSIPRMGRTNDRAADLVASLGLDSGTRQVRVRSAIGPSAQFNLLTFLGTPPNTWLGERAAKARTVMNVIGRPHWDPLIAWMSFDARAEVFPHALVADVVAEDATLAPDYIEAVRTASVSDLRTQRPPAGAPLLHHLVRCAALREYDRVAAARLGMDRRPDPELVGFPAHPAQTLWHRLDSMTNVLDDSRAVAYRAALAELRGLSTAELERLLTETLDLCSHRLDAWITSLAAKRLDEMRRDTAAGSYLGAYGWVVSVRPGPEPRTETLPDQRNVMLQPENRGYIHGPGMAQAAAAAVLRDSAKPPDLTSPRVQSALRVLELLRSGEPLASILGAQFERGLRERDAAASQTWIDFFRDLCPLVANKRTYVPLPSTSVAARNVVDGLRLHTLHTSGQLILDPTWFPPASVARTAVEAGLRGLDDTLEAIADLLGTESVHQLMRGNTGGAAAVLETIAQGGRPAEVEAVRESRGGTTLTHRVAVVAGEGLMLSRSWPQTPSPRSTAEPYLNAWYGRMLGDPSTIVSTVLFATQGLPGAGSVTLSDLQLQPIDFVSMGEAELEMRIGDFFQADSFSIDDTPATDRSVRSFRDALELAASLRDLVRGARPLQPGDLVLSAQQADAANAVVANGTRAADALDALDQAANQLDSALAGTSLTALRAALLRAAAFGIADAYVPHNVTLTPTLRERARGVLDQLQRRLGEARGKTADEDVAHAVFGRDFVFLPAFIPAAAPELARALSASATLVSDSFVKQQWLQKAAPVRPALQRWRRTTLLAGALGAPPPSLDVVQLPVVAGAQWVALPFASERERPQSGTISIMLDRAAAPPAQGKWAGLLIDEWSEVIPAATDTTAVALQYRNRRAEAPQMVLIAVPPDRMALRWNIEWIVGAVRETQQLTKIRGVDPDVLGEIGQLVPALMLAMNAAGDTVSFVAEQPFLPET